MDIKEYKVILCKERETERRFSDWNDLLKTYLCDARHYLETIYFKATGLQLCNITMNEADSFVNRKHRLKRNNLVYMYVLEDFKLYCQPGNVVYDYYQPLEWPWNIPSVDWSKLGKNVWSIIINKLETSEKLDVSSLNRQFNTWMKEDMFWKDFRSYIDSRFTIYSHMSVFETIQHVFSLKKKQYTKWIDFCFCFMFQYPGFQRAMIPGSFVSNTDKKFTRVKEFCTDGICIQFRRKKSGPRIWVYYNDIRISIIDFAKLENFISWFMIMDETLRINLDPDLTNGYRFLENEGFISAFDEIESKIKKLKRSF